MRDEDRRWDIQRGEAEEAYRESKADERWDIVCNVTEAVGFDDYYTNGTDIWCNGEMGVYIINDYLLEKSCDNEYTADYIREVMVDVYCNHINSYQPKGINQ